MNKTFRKVFCLALVSCMLLSCAAVLSSCGEPDTGYTYNDAVVTLSTNWNPHTYQTADESYPIDFITTGLYSFIFNDELNPVEGKEPFAGYKIVPEMAAEMPVDVTEAVKAAHPEFKIPESATAGYAYTIKLNPAATWENGVAINAETYIYSMKELLNPLLKNYRASDYYAGDFCIAGAEFYANQGQTVGCTPNTIIANEGLADLDAYLTKFAASIASVNWSYSFGDTWAKLGKAPEPAEGEEPAVRYAWDGSAWVESADGEYGWTGTAADEMVKTEYTVAQMFQIFKHAIVNEWGYSESVARQYFADEVESDWTYPENVSFDTVGLYKNGEYEITIVFGKSLAGFNLLYNLSGNWIVYKDLYEDGKKQVEGSDLWVTDYNTSKKTTMSYGPYKMTGFKLDASMTFEKNENWFGYTDGKHVYVDPEDGQTYDMYQTTKIVTKVVAEADTRKLMFLKGQLMGYGLQADDFTEYRNSEWCYATPSETIFFFIFNGYKEMIDEREAADGFDQATTDLQTMTLKSFRQAVAVTYDKEALCTAVSPSRSGGYGLIGNSYIYDPDTGARYRDTEQAKKALCEFYSVDISKFDSLDEAVDSITGYDPVAAKDLYTKAYNEAIELGYITDENEDGKSDQKIVITYASSATSDFIKKTLAYLNEKMAEVLVGTPFEGKIEFVESAPLGNEWSNHIKGGLADTVLGGWSGSALNPFGLSDLYANPTYQYDAKWFNSSSVSITMEVNVAKIGEAANVKEVTMNLKQWSDALNGKTITIGEDSYCFGDGIADVETRLDILAKIESTVLQTYDYIPMLQDASMSLLSKQVYYVVEEYNPIMGRGGIRYLKYHYNNAEWKAYVKSQGGKLTY